MMKGISPLIATVMMIATVVAIGSMIFLWITEYASETTDITGARGTDLSECMGSVIKVDSVTSDNIIYSNLGSTLIRNITIYDALGNNVTSGSSLNAGEVGNAKWTREANDSILIRGLCRESVVVKGNCKRGRTCWK